MHVAYNVHSVLKVEIESITAYDNNVILGTRSGQLIMYSVDEHHVDMLMFNKNFSKKAIVQMEVIAPERLLFVLTDAMIHVCDISHAFNFINSSPETKGCSLFSVDVQTPISTTGATTTLIRVCCAIKRRLEFFFWKLDKLHSPQFSIELKDIPKALCWVDDIMCVGFKDEYIIYNIRSKKPEKFDLIVTSSHNVDPCVCRIKDNLLGVSKDEFLVPIDPSLYVDKDKDNKPKTGIFDPSVIGKDAKTQLKPMAWSGNLLNLVWDEPYAIGRVSNCIEVRSLDSSGINKDTLVQNIPLNKIKFLVRSAKGLIFAASVSELWCIRMEDIKVQLQELLQQKKFQLAIELTNISSEPEDKKLASVRQIHMRSAREFFKMKLFAEAMTDFIKGQADPYDVIRLFPNLWPEQTPGATPNSEEAVLVPEVKQNLDDRDMENALVALIDYLKWARQKEVVRLRDTKNTSKSLLSIIDTTMLKCYLQTNDPLVPSLLRLNQCHFEESEKILKKYNKTSELIILYKKNGKHKKALELLQSQSTIEGSSLYGYEQIIEYLQGLGSSHLQLIFEFSNWVLQQQPEEGLKIFTKDLIEIENLPRASILDFLLSNHRSLVIPYLEHVIHVWKDPNTLIHNVLIKQYREKIQSLMNETNDGKNESGNNELLKTLGGKLYDLLKNSNNYSPDVVLKDFPTNIMLEERALILGRLKKHEKVLAIYIQILGDIEKASQYCEENYNDDNNIFLLLLKTILNPLKQPPYEGIALHPDFIKPNHDIVLNLLNKYAEKISPYKVWPYLPDDMPLHRLNNYLDTVLRTQMAAAHHNQIKEGLMLAEILRLQNLVQEEENKSVEITENTVCPDCKKRFPNQSAFVRYPNGQVVHLSCHDKRTSNSNA